jgi:hypothetical protein
MRPAGSRLERLIAFFAVAGEQLIDPLPRHRIDGSHMSHRTSLDNNSSDHQAGFRHAQTQAELCRLCLATSVAYVMKQDTLGSTSSDVHFRPFLSDLTESTCSSKLQQLVPSS